MQYKIGVFRCNKIWMSTARKLHPRLKKRNRQIDPQFRIHGIIGKVQDFQSTYSSDSTGHVSSRCIDFEFHISNRWRQDDGHILHFTLDSSKASGGAPAFKSKMLQENLQFWVRTLCIFNLVLLVVQWG